MAPKKHISTVKAAEPHAAIESLRKSVEQQRSSSVFACGGKIPVLSENSADGVSSLPVDIRWDALAAEADVSSKRTKLVLPLEPKTEGNLEQLVADTQPATFGRGGEDVYDEQYRKATKMDPANFSTTFNPYTLGIVDEISQSLLPSAIDSKHARAVRAELYKLNIYSGPSGKFKAHVDTPRAAEQFGSLVVCLPLDHDGGALEVRHEGNFITFDWGKEGKSDTGDFIRWAAFYSDCEHEVLEVTSGHRITLTYNLYAIRGNGLLAGHCQTLDATQLPLYKQVVDILREPSFMPDGGCLGFYCQHAYPHSNKLSCLPDTLKGVDMMLFETFRVLGYKTHLRPVIKDDDAAERNSDRYARGPRVPELHIGKSLEFHVDNGYAKEYEEFDDMMKDWRTWPKEGRIFNEGDVVWATEPKHEEAQLFYLTYGNEASAQVTYSNCSIIVEIPAWAGREASTAISGQQ